MKRYTLAISALLLAAGTFFIKQYKPFSAANEKNAAEVSNQTKTEIYIINGDHEEGDWFAGPSKSELLKALYEYPQHLFITPTLWKSFCYHRTEQLNQLKKQGIDKPFEQLKVEGAEVYLVSDPKKSFSQNDDAYFKLATILAFDEEEWEFYDTNIGLYYLRPKDDLHDIGLPIDQFKKIERPCSMQVELEKKSWVEGFINLFDINAWKQAHNNGRKKIVCISGHGTHSKHPLKRACGVPADAFASLMLFLNDTLGINTIGIQTCFWPAERILTFLKEHGKNHLDCQLITPIDKEQEVHYRSEMPLVWSYEPSSKNMSVKEAFDGELLFTSLDEIGSSFKGTVTEELKETLEHIQVVQMNHDYNLKTSLVAPQATAPVFV